MLSIEQDAEGKTVAVRPTPTATVAGRGRGSTETQDLTQLLRLAAQGRRVLPCRMRGKEPLLRDWPTHASSNSEQIVSWNQQWPDCNWACATGAGSGVFVLDVDGESGETSLKLLPGELPTTLTTKTGRGFHFWFQWPNGRMIRNSTGELGEGLDIRGERGCVMVPPSMHPSGKRYEFTVPEADIAVPPQWLVDAISAPLSQPYPSDQGGDLIEPGRRNSSLASMAGAMRRRGMTPQAIEAALLAENSARCHPPLPEAEVREIARSVSRYAPAPKPQNPELETASLLEDTRHFIRRFLVISDAQAITLCLFILYTYAAEQFECAPYLQVASAEKRCGKSRLLEVLELLVNRPWLTSRTSAAALVRKLHHDRPTLLLDESDAAFSGDRDYSEALRGVLNAGHRKGGKVSLCFGKGCDIKVVDLDVFGPKVIAGIGKLPDTVADRAIPIQLHRKTHGENVERFRLRLIAQAARDLQGRLAHWPTEGRLEMLRCSSPELPESLSDRQQDVSEPLLAVADLAGSEWGRIGRAALTELFGGAAAVDESLGVTLLSDIRAAFDGHDRLSSKELVAALVEAEGSPWPEWNHGRGITVNTVARLLRKFDIIPRTIRIEGDTTAKGYLRECFEDAWTRYLPGSSTSALPAVTTSQTAKILSEPPFPQASHAPDVTVQESEEEPVFMGLVTPVTVQTPVKATHTERALLVGEL